MVHILFVTHTVHCLAFHILTNKMSKLKYKLTDHKTYLTDRETDKHDETNSRVSKFCERVSKNSYPHLPPPKKKWTIAVSSFNFLFERSGLLHRSLKRAAFASRCKTHIWRPKLLLSKDPEFLQLSCDKGLSNSHFFSVCVNRSKQYASQTFISKTKGNTTT